MEARSQAAFGSISQSGGTDMKSRRSWKWLAPRITSRHVRSSDSAKRASGRPCLAVERLEDRNLLAALSPNDATTIGPPPPPVGEQVVVDLLQGGIQVNTDEIQLLNVLATATPVAKVNMQEIVIKKDVDKASAT